MTKIADGPPMAPTGSVSAGDLPRGKRATKPAQPVDAAVEPEAVKHVPSAPLYVSTTRWLRNHRGRLLSPARVAAPFGAYLTAMAELLAAIGADLDDARWLVFATKLEGIARDLRAFT